MNKLQIFKVLAIAFVVMAFSAGWNPAFAQETMEDKITLTLDRADGRYDLGETVAVHADVPEEFVAIREVWINGLLESEEQVLVEAGSYDILTRCYYEPTSVMLKFRNPDSKQQKKDFTDIGYCVGMEGFKPGFEKPADFYEWWQSQVAKLRTLPIESKMTEVEVPEKYADEYELPLIDLTPL